MTRVQRFLEICRLSGKTVTVLDPGSGWPGLIDVEMPNGAKTRVALHVSAVGSHARQPYESRFQNPGDSRPVSTLGGSLPILVGQAEIDGQSILVAVDGTSRVARDARFSILFNNNVLRAAASLGWAVYESSSGERIYAFLPELFPIFVELVRNNVDQEFSEVASDDIRVAVAASGMIEEPNEVASERVRRAANVLIRNYAFGGRVVRAYRDLCAMCGLDTGLVVGAHIFPVAAPNSPDRIWNGLALCHNHHAAFDQHKIWVQPRSHTVRYRPDLLAQSHTQPALNAFISNTFNQLADPIVRSDRPREDMFEERYKFFKGKYDWAEAS